MHASFVSSFFGFYFVIQCLLLGAILPMGAVRGDVVTMTSCYVVDEHGNQVENNDDPVCRAASSSASGDSHTSAAADDELDDPATASDVGIAQVFPDSLGTRERRRMEVRWEQARRYMLRLRSDPLWGKEEDSCRNVKPHCLLWSVRGECRSNPTYMDEMCGPVCFSCHAAWARGHQMVWLRDQLVLLGADLGAVQLTRGPDDRSQVVALLDDARSYLASLDSPASTTTTTTTTNIPRAIDSCYLKHRDCAHWAIQGNCQRSGDGDDKTAALRRQSMIRLCAPLCRACHLSNATHSDDDSDNDERRSRFPTRPPTDAVVDQSLGRDLGVAQNLVVVDNDDDDAVPNFANITYRLDDLSALLGRISADRAYLESYQKEEAAITMAAAASGGGAATPAASECRNRHEHCAAWSMGGECQANARFMSKECPVSCRTCDRCRKDPHGTDAWGPGDLDRTFEAILADPANQPYRPRVLSRPTYAPGDTADNATYQIGMWLLLFDQLLTESEASELLRVVQQREFNPSRVLSGFENSQSVNRESKARTSHQTWCMDECEKHPAHRKMVERISNITGISSMNFESTQVPRYVEGQYYHRHNDCIPQHEFLPFGPRILTAFVYLTHVEAGGGTEFPVLNLTAMPKPGRAVLWPSVHNDRPNTKDGRADHAALVVEKGVKYGANIWIHQRDYKTPYMNDCS